MRNFLQGIVRRIRWLISHGFLAASFRQRYQRFSADAWGYLGNALHAERLQRILIRIPEGSEGTLLEVGCAEGFITRHLAKKFGRVIACDVAEEAVRRASAYCQGLPNIEFCCTDIRQAIPVDEIDVCLASDVLYYLSPKEIRSFSSQLAARMNCPGYLIVANEWNEGCRHLTHPEVAVRSMVATGLWRCLLLEHHPLDLYTDHWIGVCEVLSLAVTFPENSNVDKDAENFKHV